MRLFENLFGFFNDDNDYVKRVLICILGALFLFLGIFAMVCYTSYQGNLSKRARYTACTTISDETLRRDCIQGPQEQDYYDYPDSVRSAP